LWDIEASEPVSEVGEVGGFEGVAEDLGDHRLEVVQRSDGFERGEVGGPAATTGGRQHDRGGDDLEGDPAVEEGLGEALVVRAAAPEGIRRGTVELEDCGDEGLSVGHG